MTDEVSRSAQSANGLSQPVRILIYALCFVVSGAAMILLRQSLSLTTLFIAVMVVWGVLEFAGRITGARHLGRAWALGIVAAGAYMFAQT